MSGDVGADDPVFGDAISSIEGVVLADDHGPTGEELLEAGGVTTGLIGAEQSEHSSAPIQVLTDLGQFTFGQLGLGPGHNEQLTVVGNIVVADERQRGGGDVFLPEQAGEDGVTRDSVVAPRVVSVAARCDRG